MGSAPTLTNRILTMTTAIDVKQHLLLLHEERALAIEAGLGADLAYMDDLEDEIAATQAAWVGAAVTEIATLRAQLSGPQLG